MRILVPCLLLILTAPAAAAQDSSGQPMEAPQDAGDPPAVPSVELPSELERVLREYESAWAAGNAQALAQLFTDDGFVRSDGGWIRGREAIRAKYENAGGPLRLRATAYSADATSGYIVGAYGYGEDEAGVGADDQAVVDRGVFVLALRRNDAESPWLIAADLDNSIAR